MPADVKVESASVYGHHYYLDDSAFHYYRVPHYIEKITLEKNGKCEVETIFVVGWNGNRILSL